MELSLVILTQTNFFNLDIGHLVTIDKAGTIQAHQTTTIAFVRDYLYYKSIVNINLDNDIQQKNNNGLPIMLNNNMQHYMYIYIYFSFLQA